ncbi:MAG: hypothetical protein NC548_37735 [Lachnospiraceae bacterium]|nr:hypothetical protein [Lachnospiraceae bacterium]MCM1441382.1 hypothetical protein [Roseburia sp.]
MDRSKIDNALKNEREKYLRYEEITDVSALESLYLRIAKEIPEDLDSQPLVIAMEECGELSQAIAKGIRGKADPVHLAEEIADVSIIIDYVKKTWEISDEDIEIIRALKLEQLEGIVARLQTEYGSKLSPLSMMDTFTTLRKMDYDGFINAWTSRVGAIHEIVTLDQKCCTADAFVEVHWRKTPQINEDGLNVIRGTMKTITLRARSMELYTTKLNDDAVRLDNEDSVRTKLLWATYQIDALIWVLALTFARFSVLNAWVGDEMISDIISTKEPVTHATYTARFIDGLRARVREFIDGAEYNEPTVTVSTNIRKALNEALSAIKSFEYLVFSEIERTDAESATWKQLMKLIDTMKGDDSDAGGSV